MNLYKITIIDLPQNKHKIIESCDMAFSSPVSKRENYSELFEKIDKNAIFIAAYDEEPMGYAAIYANNKETRTAYITLIAVKPEFQGRKIGRALMEACEKVSNENEMKCIMLEVAKSNLKAIRFYEKCGFEVCMPEKESSLYMRKEIGRCLK